MNEIDLQQALDRSSHTNSKLAALADIALGSDAPISAGLIRDHPVVQHDDVASIHIPVMPSPVGKVKARVTPATAAANIAGNKLGFKAKKRQPVKSNTVGGKRKFEAARKLIRRNDAQKPIDIYDFEDSRESVDTPILRHSKPTDIRQKIITKEMITKVCDLFVANNLEKLNPKAKAKPVMPVKPVKPVPIPIPIERPKSCDVSMNNEEVSSTSFSDNDNFNYGIQSNISESDLSDAESVASNVTDGDRSLKKIRDVTANNLQKKCVIMGRIFKNAKKSKDQIQDVVIVEKPKLLPVQDLDKLFDSLKGCESKENEAEDIVEEATDVTTEAKGTDQEEKKKTIKNNPIEEKEEIPSVQSNRKSKKSGEIQMLEAEWGMSLEQIKEIIGVGQRKSQRKCAVGKQKILAETWSSDEYEDFHTTKDIIELIQETEMKALQRKRNHKGSEVIVAASPIVAKENISNVSNTKAVEEQGVEVPTRTGTETETVKLSDEENQVERVEPIVEKEVIVKQPKRVNFKQRRLTTTTAANHKSNNHTFRYDSESDFEAEWKRSGRRSKIKRRRKTVSAANSISVGSVNDDDLLSPSDELPPPQPQITKRNVPQSRPKPMPQKHNHNDRDNDVYDGYGADDRRKRRRCASDLNDDDEDGGEVDSGKPLGRNKRIASEMLYYWSSSSDDEFGRIADNRRKTNKTSTYENNNDGNDDGDYNRRRRNENDDEDEEDVDDDDEGASDTNGEHLQQHGWIVGDSHKKLVTLLAHAKGKKSDDCGVKEGTIIGSGNGGGSYKNKKL